MGFDDDTALRPAGPGAFEGAIDERWWTPRGPLGGYVMAIMLRGAMLAAEGGDRPPRSLTVHFLRPPQAGAVTVLAEVARAGRSLTTVRISLVQEEELLAVGLAALSRPWTGPVLSEAPMPEVDPPRHGPDRPPPEGSPPFMGALTMERRFGEPPFTGADTAETGGWLGLREQREVDELVLAVLADAWFPAPWTRLTELAPAPTIEMTVYFRAALPLAPTPLLGRFRTGLVREGFFDESGELWAPDGTLVAQSRQLALLLGLPDRE